MHSTDSLSPSLRACKMPAGGLLAADSSLTACITVLVPPLVSTPGDIPLPIPGPKPPSSPFDASTWGTTMARLGLQVVCYGLLAVLLDAGLPGAAWLRHWWASGSRGVGGPAANGARHAPGGSLEAGKENSAVVEERQAVEARQGCGPEECSVR